MGALKKSNINRLHNKGYKNYQEYLLSPHWKRVKETYYKSDRPKCCAACGRTPFDLHHRSYSRIATERLNDIIPLCRRCHYSVHDYVNQNPGQVIQATTVILRRMNGWTREEWKNRMSVFDGKEGLDKID